MKLQKTKSDIFRPVFAYKVESLKKLNEIDLNWHKNYLEIC